MKRNEKRKLTLDDYYILNNTLFYMKGYYFILLGRVVSQTVFVILFCFCALAEEANLVAPLALSMGGAGRASVGKGAEYHLLNPAGVAHTKQTQSAGYYIFGDLPNPYWGISLSENNRLPIGASFIKQWDTKKYILAASLAGFIVPGWSLGVSIKRLYHEIESGWSMQSGILIKPKGQKVFSLGVVWNHILVSNKAFKANEQIGLAASYLVNQWLYVHADAIYYLPTTSVSTTSELVTNRTKPSQKKWMIIGAIETIFSQFLVFRMSARWDVVTGAIFYSGGSGLQGKRIGLDYSIYQNDKQNWIHGWNIHTAF